MDIDEILERAEKVEEKETGEEGNELLSAFKVSIQQSPLGLETVLCFIFCSIFPIS